MRIGQYEVLGQIGSGGVGVVHRARSPGGGYVAIKVLLKTDPEKLARFDRERRLLSSFRETEGFVSLVDAGSSPLGPYLVMPFVSGGTLRARLAQGSLSVEETLRIGRAVAAAAAQAHGRGIVHRDLKPENVLFADDGRPLVADLGLAKHFARNGIGSAASVSLSRTNDFRGTAGYMAPEQIQDSRSVGPPADVFALGAILYECLTGEPAFSAPSLVALIDRVMQGEPQPLARLAPDAPAWLVATTERALARDPAQRFANGAELLAALHPPLLERGQEGALASWKRALAFGGVALVVAAGVALAVHARKPESSAVRDGLAPVTTATPTVAFVESREEASRLVERARHEAEALRLLAAIETAEQAIALDPTLAQARLAKGAAELARRDFEAARADLDRAIGLDARDASGWFLRGCARRGAGDRDGALADLSKALELDGRHVLALVERSKVRIAQGDIAAAERDLAAALAVDSRSAQALGMRGVVRTLLGDERAGDDIALAVSIDARTLRRVPDGEFLGFSAGGDTFSSLVEFCVRKRRSEPWALAVHSIVAPSNASADEEASRSVELAPGLAIAWYARALRKRYRNAEGAFKDLEKAIALDPAFAAAWVERAISHFCMGDRTRAHTDLDRAVELDARNLNAWAWRAEAREDEGDFEGALAASERVLEVARNADQPVHRSRIERLGRGEAIYLEDAPPLRSEVGGGDDGDPWEWVSADPTPFSGTLCLRSRLAPGVHQQFFHRAKDGLLVHRGDVLFAYVWLDPANPPREIMLQWEQPVNGWDHRAYWGEDLGLLAAKRERMGPLPETGTWVRLEVPARKVGLEDRIVTGMAFTLIDGRAAWDHAGRR